MADIFARTQGDVVAEIKMSLAAFCGVHILVEGGADSSFWKLRFNQSAKCQLVICGSKPVVVSSITQLDKMALGEILGVIDDDFDSILGISYLSKNLLNTDTHDLETMFLSSMALKSVLIELGDSTKINHFVARTHKSVVDALIDNSLVFGRLRLLNARNNWGVDFSKFSPWKYVDPSTWQVVKTKLFTDFASQIGATPLHVENAVTSEIGTPHWNIIQGHDAINILAIGLRSILATKQQVGEKELIRLLRLSYDNAMFQSSALFGKISAWAKSNNSVVV
jgi:hypothetical protein